MKNLGEFTANRRNRLLLKAISLGLVAFLNLTQVGAAVSFNDNLCIRAIIGEASNQGYQGMLAVAVGIRNRGTLQGVYGVRAKHIDKQPKWVWEQAKKAWEESKHNRIHSGTHWENIKAFGTPYWVKDMVKVYEHKDHIFYKPNKLV